MNNKIKTPLYSEEDHDFLGYIVNDGTSWLATTIFGYTISRTDSRNAAEQALYEQGLTYLQGIWQYYDKEDHDWFSCVIKEASELKVIVNRTNALGYLDPDDYKQVVIESPSEDTLIKSA